jgi:hypothetical protein
VHNYHRFSNLVAIHLTDCFSTGCVQASFAGFNFGDEFNFGDGFNFVDGLNFGDGFVTNL